MNQNASVWMVVVGAVVAANLPFVNERLFFVGPLRHPKAFVWRLAELVSAGVLTLVLGFALESSIGQRSPQGWEFFASAGCLFLTLAFPGFVWRYLRRGGGVAA